MGCSLNDQLSSRSYQRQSLTNNLSKHRFLPLDRSQVLNSQPFLPRTSPSLLFPSHRQSAKLRYPYHGAITYPKTARAKNAATCVISPFEYHCPYVPPLNPTIAIARPAFLVFRRQSSPAAIKSRAPKKAFNCA